MYKNQNISYKFTKFVLFFFWGITYPSHSQSFDSKENVISKKISSVDLLNKADSLFALQQYTESYPLYNQIFEQEKYSPGMLLKMAFIQEGLGDFGLALYFLNLYYLETSNKEVLTKMAKLAENNQLRGYEQADIDWFLSFYYKYQSQVILAIIALTFFIFAVIYYQKRIHKKRPFLLGIFYVLILGFLYFQINWGFAYEKGIIMNPHSYIMRGPSAGADVLQVVRQGHRVEIIGKDDVWLKINWEGQTAYIKETNIRKVEI